GTVELFEKGRLTGAVSGGTPHARDPICPEAPRRFTARAVDVVNYLAIDSELLDVMITWDQTGTYEVADLQAQMQQAAESDWMTALLRNHAIQRLPAAKLQTLFHRMEHVAVRAGDVLIRQGEAGDFFFTLVSGRCVVTRETPTNVDGIKLAEFSAGDSVGEEALISDLPRSATVSMLTDGAVMRLHKSDFLELLGGPLIERVTFDEAKQRIASGAVWLDVRLPSDFQSLAIEGAVNIPLYFLRLKLATLDPRRAYVVYCGDGRRSAAAAYILTERGFTATVLDQGIAAVESGLRRSNDAV
ncbi:MAG: hypothetical protein RLZZ200_3184, partial [Pseudomonadota bacterium]